MYKRQGIKWVNDIYINGKKICGILTEALTDFESGGIESIILGIGINFSTAVSCFPESIQQKVDSLFHEKPAGITRNQIIAAIINHVLSLCNHLQDRSFIEEYKARSIVSVSYTHLSAFRTAFVREPHVYQLAPILHNFVLQ